jgi:hypothetical protein
MSKGGTKPSVESFKELTVATLTLVKQAKPAAGKLSHCPGAPSGFNSSAEQIETVWGAEKFGQ